jgi:hypothetical protein
MFILNQTVNQSGEMYDDSLTRNRFEMEISVWVNRNDQISNRS